MLDPSEIDFLIPEPDGLTLDEAVAVVEDVARRIPVAGVGITGLAGDERDMVVVGRLLTAAGL